MRKAEQTQRDIEQILTILGVDADADQKQRLVGILLNVSDDSYDAATRDIKKIFKCRLEDMADKL